MPHILAKSLRAGRSLSTAKCVMCLVSSALAAGTGRYGQSGDKKLRDQEQRSDPISEMAFMQRLFSAAENAEDEKEKVDEIEVQCQGTHDGSFLYRFGIVAMTRLLFYFLASYAVKPVKMNTPGVRNDPIQRHRSGKRGSRWKR